MGGLVGTDPELLTQVVSSTGEPLMMPDIRKLDILNRRMIVSRKRKRNLFDLTSQWKKLVLATLDKVLRRQQGATNNSDQELNSCITVVFTCRR